MSSEVSFIVDKLNEDPFNYELSLVTFSEKTPEQLLQLVSDVFAVISPQQEKRDIRNEAPEHTTTRLLDFLRYVKYKPTVDMLDFRQGFSMGEVDIIYPVLNWVLPRAKELEKRAFVGYYLSNVQIPEELFQDPDVMDVFQQNQELQGQFVESHKVVEQMRVGSQDPNKLRVRMQDMEEERGQLQARIEKLKAKVDKVPNLQELQEAATKLRRQQEEEVNLQGLLKQQKMQLEQSEAKYQRALGRLREIKQNTAEGSSASLLSQLAEETSQNRYMVREKLPKELAAKRKQKETVHAVLSEPVTRESDLNRLITKRDSINGDINAIMERRARSKGAQGDKSDLQLRQQQQMANVVAKKKEEVYAKLDRLTEKKRNIMMDYERRMQGQEGGGMMGGMGGGGARAAVSAEDVRAKYESVKRQLGTYKAMKREMDILNGELLVAGRTRDIMAGEAHASSAALSEVEKAKGVTGFQDTQATLEQVSAAKSEIDETKAGTLEEISGYVADINSAIKERKNKLAPQIKELRTVRQHYQDLEGQHAEKKRAYEAQAMGYESKNAKLSSEVTAMRNDTLEAERRFHMLNCLGAVVDADVKRVTSASKSEQESLKERYQRQIKAQEELSKTLKARQREVKDNSEPNKEAVGMMQDLTKLLELKLQLCRRGNVPGGGMGGGMGGMGGSMGAGGGGMGMGGDLGGANVMVL